MPSGAVLEGRAPPSNPKSAGLPGATRQRVGLPLRSLIKLSPPPPQRPRNTSRGLLTLSRKHTRPFKALNIAMLLVIADTVGCLHEDAVRLLCHGAIVKASCNVDNGGLVGREPGNHPFGLRRAAIFSRHQADPGL
jgi:hypothetical protein